MKKKIKWKIEIERDSDIEVKLHHKSCQWCKNGLRELGKTCVDCLTGKRKSFKKREKPIE